MERWKKITYMAAAYMFLTELRPIEPYMSAYLTGPNGNVSLSEVKCIKYENDKNIHSFDFY